MDPRRGARSVTVRALASLMSVGGITMSLAAATGLATASAAPAAGTDTCGYPNSSGGQSATVFNESTLTRWVQVFGSGSAARVGVFSNDENGVLLGVGATPSTGVAHVSGPSLGSLSATDPSGRPYYPSLFITNVTSNASSTAGDWQHGGSGTTFVSDAYGTWVTGSFVNGVYKRDALPSKNDWNLGSGADSPSPGFSALGNEGYGSEFTWNIAALGLQPGNTYRLQVMTHDGDQNRSGGDVGELCTSLTIPGSPATPAVTVQKTNNASGNGFAKTSTAPQAGTNVPFQLVVTNTSNESETVTSLTDAWPNTSIQPDCRTSGGTALLGATLASGASVTCTFTLNGYSPPAGQSVTDTVAVTVTDANHQTASDTSTSTVFTPAVITQNISGSVLLCDANGNRTSVPVNGGSLQVLSGNSVLMNANDQLPPAAIAAGTYTLAGSAPSGYNFVACGLSGVTISTPPTTASQTVVVPAGSSGSGVFYVSPAVVTQSISGSVLLCDANGNRTSVPVNGASLKVLSGNSVVLSANDQLAPTSVAAGTYTLAGTAPSGYNFVPCGLSGVNISTPPTTASQTVVVPAGSSGSGVFYVTPVVVGSQSISGSVLLCDANGNRTSVPVNGGSLQVLSGSTVVFSANDQLPPVSVAAGTYTLAGSAPSGYKFVPCGLSGVNISTPPTTASQTVVVPAGSSGSGVFYVSQIVVGSQSISGSILLCDANGNQTTTPVNGGSIQVMSGTSVILSANNQLPPATVAAGTYAMTGSAPSGYQFVPCGATGVTIASPPATASQTVVVPAGSSGSGVFYVRPVVVNQTVGGSILLCDANGNRTTTPVNGGALQVLSGTTVFASATDQLSPAVVPAGVYTMTATAPLGYKFDPCGGTGVTIASPPTSANQTVTVPAGQNVMGVFYVDNVPLVATIDKTNNAAGTGYGKVEIASAAGQDVAFRAVITNNSVVPVVITSLSDAWPGQVPFSPACAQAVVGAVLAANGGSVTCDFTITNYAPPAGQYLVDTVTATLSQLDVASNSTVSSNSTTIANTSTVGTTAVLGEQLTPPTTVGQITTVAPSVSPSVVSPSVQATAPLAFSGAPSRLWEVLELGLALLSAGCFVLWLTRPREFLPLTGRM